MAYKYEYISLDDVLTQILRQAKKDVSWMQVQVASNCHSAQYPFYYLKSVTSYQDDPENVELIQSPKSLFLKNWYGVPGRGDCDCFTCLSICALIAIGYKQKQINILLVGRKPKAAVHIYVEVDGEPFDLTNTFFAEMRKYNFFQKISIFDRWHM